MKSLNDFLRELVTPGTPACGLIGGAAGIAVAAMLLSIGLWKTIFVAVLCLVGMFLGGVKDKSGFVKKLVNKLFPSKE